MHLNLFVGYDGPSRGIIGQMKYMDRDLFQPVICEIKPTQHPELVKNVKDMGCEHICLNRNRAYDVSIIPRLVRVLKQNRIDIMNTHNALACWYGNLAAKLAGIPVVFTLRNNQRENYKLLFKRKLFYETARLLDRLSMRIADMTVAVSKRLEQYYINYEKTPPDRITTISNAIDLEMIEKHVTCDDRQRIREKAGAGEDTVVVGIVGDLVERKGHDCLVEAARTVLERQNDTLFLIIGDGPLRTALEQKINEYGMADHFIFTGHIKNVYQHVSAMDIFVLPSYAEGISRALMESMAMGKPSVCSAIDGNKEAVRDGETGFLFPVNDSEILADRLISLIKNRKLLEKMGEKARLRAKEVFDIKVLTQKYEGLYQELVNRREARK